MSTIPVKPYPFVIDPAALVASEDALRLMAAESYARLTPAQTPVAIKHISIIGTQRVDFNSPHADRDTVRLGLTMQYMMQSGVAIHPDFEIDCIDFRDGRDFLAETTPTDMVFASYIRGDQAYESRYYDEEFLADTKGYNPDKPDVRRAFFHAQSPLTPNDGWRQRVLRSRAKIFAAFGGAIEVGTQHVVQYDGNDAFVELIPNPDIPEILVDERKQVLGQLYPTHHGLDLPCAWLGFAFKKTYALKMLETGLGTDTFMGRKLETVMAEHAWLQQRAHEYRSRPRGPLTRIVDKLFPGLRAMFELQSNHVGFDRLKAENTNTKRDHRPKNGVHP